MCGARSGLTGESVISTQSTWTFTAARLAGNVVIGQTVKTITKVRINRTKLIESNVNNLDCPTWGKKGFCSTGKFVSYMKQNCKKTCNLC